MSRSYKKTPIIKDNGRTKKYGKHFANKAVNTFIDNVQNEDFFFPQNKSYKKLYDSWEIADFTSRCSEEEWRKKYEEGLKSPREWERKFVNSYTLEEWMLIWFKSYRRK